MRDEYRRAEKINIQNDNEIKKESFRDETPLSIDKSWSVKSDM
jgi:hypothetical protein